MSADRLPVPKPGVKVILAALPEAGFGEIVSADQKRAEVRFFTSPIHSITRKVDLAAILPGSLPVQSRCFHKSEGVVRYGRVIAMKSLSAGLRSYFIKFPDKTDLELLREDDFQVRSYLPADDPAEVLAELAIETPFFFENRAALLREWLRQGALSHGLTALLSSKIEILPHQAEVADRVLRDPTIRYLLADEVGLGKTIEAGVILRQLAHDAPNAAFAVVVPDALVVQWEDELRNRFGLEDVEVFPHTSLIADKRLHRDWHAVVIDEAHRIVARHGEKETPLTKGAAKLAARSRHLLLLSATPVVHHDTDLLALLALLDPANYSRAKLDSFRERATRRTELGRALLALRNATLAPLVKRNAAALAALLPDDATLRSLAADIAKAGSDLPAIQRGIQLHVSETYRIYRRMLRTRRRWLADAEKRFVRDVREDSQCEIDEEPHAELWTALEAWRAAVAKRVKGDASARTGAAAEYVRLAELIAAEPDKLASAVKAAGLNTGATADETKLLSKLAGEKAAAAMVAARVSLITEIVRQRAQREGKETKYVVFCPSGRVCEMLEKKLKPQFALNAIRVATSALSKADAAEVFANFTSERAARVLITDATGEEGFNLQFARAVIFHDLPWSPMRLEQRLGRLDRIEREGAIPCVVITSGEDDTLALDETWRRVLVEGFGIFKASISDLQHLIDAELPRLRERAFLSGPAALLDCIAEVAANVERERATIEEQDVIDGMHGLDAQSPLVRDLAGADRAAEDFGTALTNYLKTNVGLKEWWDEERNGFVYQLRSSQGPIIPSDRLAALTGLLNEPFSVHRTVVCEDFGLQFLRPGHAGVDGCRELLAWDDRGRAFAMWRHSPGVRGVKVIFRCIVRVAADLATVEKALVEAEWDDIRRGALLRLARGWFPEFIEELWFDADGGTPEEKFIAHCRRPYVSDVDLNMGKDRAAFVREKYGAKEWRDSSRKTAARALKAVTTGDALKQARARAEREAGEHFALLDARLKARGKAGIDSTAQSSAERKAEAAIREMLSGILAEPLVRLDTIGAYLLSEKTFWPEAKMRAAAARK